MASRRTRGAGGPQKSSGVLVLGLLAALPATGALRATVPRPAALQTNGLSVRAVAVGAPRRPTWLSERRRCHSRGPAMLISTGGAGDLLSRVAEVGLKLKLRSHDKVAVSVDSTPVDLLSGKVKRVTVEGSRWASPKELTCLELKCTVGETAIDLSNLVQRQEIKMIKPGRGTASIAFLSRDWANFLTHPLVTAVTPHISVADASGAGTAPFTFMRQGKIEARQGRALFAGRFRDTTYRFALSQCADTSGASASPLNPGEDEGQREQECVLARELSKWFSNLQVDLDGAKFRYKSLRFQRRGMDDVMLLELHVLVERFPNPVKTSF